MQIKQLRAVQANDLDLVKIERAEIARIRQALGLSNEFLKIITRRLNRSERGESNLVHLHSERNQAHVQRTTQDSAPGDQSCGAI